MIMNNKQKTISKKHKSLFIVDCLLLIASRERLDA